MTEASATLNDSMNDSIAMESQQIDIAISEKLIMKPSTIPSETSVFKRSHKIDISISGNVDLGIYLYDRPGKGVFIRGFNENSLALNDGRFFTDDQLVSINGISLQGLECKAVVKKLENEFDRCRTVGEPMSFSLSREVVFEPSSSSHPWDSKIVRIFTRLLRCGMEFVEEAPAEKLLSHSPTTVETSLDDNSFNGEQAEERAPIRNDSVEVPVTELQPTLESSLGQLTLNSSEEATESREERSSESESSVTTATSVNVEVVKEVALTEGDLTESLKSEKAVILQDEISGEDAQEHATKKLDESVKEVTPIEEVSTGALGREKEDETSQEDAQENAIADGDTETNESSTEKCTLEDSSSSIPVLKESEK